MAVLTACPCVLRWSLSAGVMLITMMPRHVVAYTPTWLTPVRQPNSVATSPPSTGGSTSSASRWAGRPVVSSEHDRASSTRLSIVADSEGSGPRKAFGGKLQGLRPNKEEDNRIKQNNMLLEWLGEQGVWVFDRSDWGQAPHTLAVALDTLDENENEREGRGMLASREIKEGDELFSVPLDVLLTRARAQQEFGKDIITDDMSEYLAIAMLLIGERAKGPESFWGPYIGILPTTEEVNPTYAWSEDDLALLEGSPVIGATRSMQSKLRDEYAALKTSIFAKRPKQFPEDVYTFEAFQWAFSILFSRAIRLASLTDGEAIALIPYADLFNHNPFANSYIDARQVGFFLNKKDVVTVYADKSYKKMEQVYISYGPKSNADLLLLYGFSLDRNPYNSVEIRVSLSKSDPMYPEKKVFLEVTGSPDEMTFPLYNDRYPDELMQYLRLVKLTPESRGFQDLPNMRFEDQIDPANELAVLEAIEQACEKALQGYPTTEEQDNQLMADRPMFRMLSKSQRMAVKHRRQEKRILKRTIAAVSSERERLRMPAKATRT